MNDPFAAYREVKGKMKHDGLVSDAPIKGKGQCGYADLNPGGFYFLIADRDKIAKRLDETSYKGAFLELVAHAAERDDDLVYFRRPYYVSGKAVPLSDFVNS